VNVTIRITGVVQGVGFRPFVYNLAYRHGLKGYCLNDSCGVVIEAAGADTDIKGFIEELKSNPPPMARIETLDVEYVKGGGGDFIVPPFRGTRAKRRGSGGGGGDYTLFTIRESAPVNLNGEFALISPDISICNDCLREFGDPNDTRYLYPFINCTNCGPRYSIIKDIPYDRPKTTMSAFEMCPECEREYQNPANRRFHAQPNACGKCGPKVWLAGHDGNPLSSAINFDAIRDAQWLFKEGAILAIKGIGGFHLACDATNDEAVKKLRDKKRSSLRKSAGGGNKPFAVMAVDAEAIKKFAVVNAAEKTLLEDRTRPIVLLKKMRTDVLSRHVAPNNSDYGVMLPYTPLHYLLFHPRKDAMPLVMTSGNLSDEPIVTSNEEAVTNLQVIADYFLLHDRAIHMRVDDSILRVCGAKKTLIRRSRGFAPEPINMGEQMPDMFAAGAELKNTFCLTKGRYAVLSQHIGDLKNIESLAFYKETLANLKNSFKSRPEFVVMDMHPEYLSAKFALEYAQGDGIPDENVISVQHHHAHIASVMAEHKLKNAVIGVAFDGTGYGSDGNIWGGEFMLSGRGASLRKAHLSYIPMPGGERAIVEPWRMAAAYLHSSLGKDDFKKIAPRIFKRIDAKKLSAIIKMLEEKINSPLTSSAGRVFDAVASIIGLRDEITFEAEAAIELEAAAGEDSVDGKNLYHFEIEKGAASAPKEGNTLSVIDLRPLITGILDDVLSGESTAVISARFHSTMAEVALNMVKTISDETGVKDIALSGGVFQNRLFAGLCECRLKENGFTVYMNERVPSNDGGVSLGQIAAAFDIIQKGNK